MNSNNNEIVQLKSTIHALRDQLEAITIKLELKFQKERSQLLSEIKQLHNIIREQRLISDQVNMNVARQIDKINLEKMQAIRQLEATIMEIREKYNSLSIEYQSKMQNQVKNHKNIENQLTKTIVELRNQLEKNMSHDQS
jgi:hypothetical protein